MLLAWLRLLRTALAPTVAWDWAAGILLAGLGWESRLLLPLAILLAIYHGGMIGNDLADRAADARLARGRPLATGELRPAAAWLALALLWGGALAAARWLAPGCWTPSLALVALAALYDFGGAVVRAGAGPVLLALLRAGALSFVPIAELGFEPALQRIGIGPIAAYAAYFLFTARLARREETGAPGNYGFALVALGAATPAMMLVDSPVAWPAAAGCLGFAALRLRVSWPEARRRAWTPDLVRAQVRAALAAAPLVPAIGLLTLPGSAALWAAGGVATSLLVRSLARRLPPE